MRWGLIRTLVDVAYMSRTASLSSMLFAAVLSLAPPRAHAVSQGRPNVLLVIADDLRPELNCYFKGDHQPATTTASNLYTPNLDKLAQQSMLFKRAYCQFSLCAPSRASFLTGRRPDTTRTWWFEQYWRKTAGNFSSLPQYFKENDYASLGFGKVYHEGPSAGFDDPISWTEMYRAPTDLEFYRNRRQSVWEAIPPKLLAEKPLPDQLTTDVALDAFRRYGPKARTGEKPFFMAVGYIKPHLPFQYTEDFVSLYNDSDIPLPPNKHVPAHMPRQAWSPLGAIASYKNYKELHFKAGYNTPLPDHFTRSLRGGYYRSVGYMDSMLGILLKGLADEGLEHNTIVAFIGDNGFQLGEQAIWRKCTNFELSLRVPMMIRVPGITDHGPETGSLVELVDLFPTLADLAGLPPVPICPNNSTKNVKVCTEGVSLVPVILDGNNEFKGAAYAQYPRGAQMGYTVRTDRYRYTEWVSKGPKWNEVHATELYDHVRDDVESYNYADDPIYADTKQELRTILRRGWRAVIDKPVAAAAHARKTWKFPLEPEAPTTSAKATHPPLGHIVNQVASVFTLNHTGNNIFNSYIEYIQPGDSILKGKGVILVFLVIFTVVIFLLKKLKLASVLRYNIPRSILHNFGRRKN